MNLRAAIFVCFIISVFSCASRPVYTVGLLDWDSDRFAEKDGRLFNAVKSGDPNRVRTALSDNPDINVSDRLRQTAFMWACHNGSLDIINMLLDHDASNIARKTKNYKKLNIKAQSKPQKPELKYNALFCYVMSNGINPYNQEARETLKKIIVKDPSILDMTDYYGETVIHKLIRSNNDYFDVIITDTDKKSERDKQALLLNKPSKMHSPLRLAVEVGNRWMVEALANAAKKDMTIKDFSNDDISVIAFDYGKGDYEIFRNYFQGKIWDDKKTKPRQNGKFLEAYTHALNTGNEAYAEKVSWFWDIYDTYVNGDVENAPELLAPEKYTAAMTEIFDLARTPMSDARKEEFYKKLEKLPDAVYSKDDYSRDDIEKRTLIQYIIEQQSVDVLERVLKLFTPYRLLPVGNGYGDYLSIALLNSKKEHMRFLLKQYPDFQSGITNLMHPKTTIEDRVIEKFFGLSSWMDPLRLFCVSSLSDDQDLLVKMAGFYRTRFNDRSYRNDLISELVSRGKYDLYEFFLDYDEHDESFSFYRINDIRTDDNQPVLEVLFINREDLARKIVNYFIRKEWTLDEANEKALRYRDGELWRKYEQRALTQPNASSRSSQTTPEQKEESEDSNLPENQAQ